MSGAYRNEADSFVIVSSDSDYRGLIFSLPDAVFLVMIEREKRGPGMKAALAEMYRWIDNSVRLNVNDMFDEALRNARIEMSRAERRQFFDKYIRSMSLRIDEEGNVSVELKRK